MFNGVKVERKKIPDYFNEYYQSAVMIYNDYKKYGFPWNVGYMEIPAYLKEIYDLFENVTDAWKNREAKK